MNPDKHPFGQTKFRNYDPKEINSVYKAIAVLEWISEENERKDEPIAAGAFQDAANLLKDSDL